MEITHADNNFNDLRFINRIDSFDCEINLLGKSDYELKVPADVWERERIEIGHIIYIAGTEFGGIVDRVKTQNKTVTICGKTWRGYLNKNLIIPGKNQAYKEFSGKAGKVIQEMIGNHFGSLYDVAESPISVKEKFRYEEIGDAIEKMLRKFDARLKIAQSNSGVGLEAVKISDWSKTYEFNEDYGVLITLDNDQSKNINHVVALGKGELENRMVLQAWLLPDGKITYDDQHKQRPKGESEYTYKLDYPSAESEDQLKESIEKVFEENRAKINSSVDFSGAQIINVEIGDIVASRDRLTNTYAKQRIVKKIYKINSSGIPELRYNVEEV